MSPERYRQLSRQATAIRLTADEIQAGWHFCLDWDGLLIGPGSPEMEVCTCRPCDHEEADGRCIHCGATAPCEFCGGYGCVQCIGVMRSMMTPTEMSAKLQRLRELDAKRTPGKWRWQANPNGRSVGVYGGRHPYDLTVMDFVRWGMDSAMPRFRDMREAGLNLMTKVTAFFVNAPQRDHHADWFQFVNHPDAEFMCAGDDMMRLIEALWAEREAQEKRIAELEVDEVTESMWGGLARDLFLAWDMGCKTPRQIFDHLTRCGREIPQWMRDEPEMQNIDHTVSKGTRAVLVYNAMRAGRQEKP